MNWLPDRMFLPLPEDLFIDSKITKDSHTALARAGQAADWIFIGDTDHTACDTRYHLTSESMMKMLAESGVSHVCIEIPAEYDPALKRFQSGEIMEAEFRKELVSFSVAHKGEITTNDAINSIVETVQAAASLNMSVHAVDPGVWRIQKELFIAYVSNPERQKTLTEDDLKTAKKLQESLKNISSIEELYLTMVQANMENPQFIEKMTLRINSDMWKKRFDDEQLSENIRAAVGDEKFAVIYGAYHADLPNHLEGKPLIIDVVNDINWIKNHNEILQKRGQSLPHAIINASNNEAYITGTMPPEMKEKLTEEGGKIEPVSPPSAPENETPKTAAPAAALTPAP